LKGQRAITVHIQLEHVWALELHLYINIVQPPLLSSERDRTIQALYCYYFFQSTIKELFNSYDTAVPERLKYLKNSGYKYTTTARVCKCKPEVQHCLFIPFSDLIAT
jgi:hypothetical protein